VLKCHHEATTSLRYSYGGPPKPSRKAEDTKKRTKKTALNDVVAFEMVQPESMQLKAESHDLRETRD